MEKLKYAYLGTLNHHSKLVLFKHLLEMFFTIDVVGDEGNNVFTHKSDDIDAQKFDFIYNQYMTKNFNLLSDKMESESIIIITIIYDDGHFDRNSLTKNDFSYKNGEKIEIVALYPNH